MHQQINLYQPVFRKQHKVFGAKTLAQIVAVALVLLLAILGHAHWTLAGMRNSATALQQQYDHMQNELTQLEATLQTTDTAALDMEIERLSASIEQRHSLLQQFDLLMVKHRNGFSTYFRILAEQHLPGLWLDGVTLDGEGRIEVRGTALQAQLVPRYLQQLEKQANLSNSSFETVSMTRPDSNKPYIQFVLRNHKDDS